MDQNNPISSITNSLEPTVSFIPLGGLEQVTRNMYLYEYGEEILIVDCGLGFADETMLGVDLLLPDISYLLTTKKKIVGMLLTHGHEDHIGALPYILPQLPQFPIFTTPLTAALANEKLKDFKLPSQINSVPFGSNDIKIGSFTVSFLRITHSVPDSSNIIIKTPAGSFYHGSDFKFDLTPADGKKTEFEKIVQAEQNDILCLMSDCLGAERAGHTPSEEALSESFDREMRDCTGKFIVTTYSSNLSRLNQAIQAAEKYKRKVCFVGRSLIKTKTIGQDLGYLHMHDGTEVEINDLKNYHDNQIMLMVAGSQGQENSAMTRIANGEHQDIKLSPQDVVIFSSDPIPGNEVSVNSLIDAIAKRGARVLYSQISDSFHVSGHGSSWDLMLLMSLVRSKYVLPISGNYKQMVAYEKLAKKVGYKDSDIFLVANGQEVIFSKNLVKFGKKIETKNVYVDQISGEEVESFVLRDREKLAKDGIVILMVEIAAENGQVIQEPELVCRGFSTNEAAGLKKTLSREIREIMSRRKGHVSSWIHIRKIISDTAGKHIFKKLRRRPLVLPVVIEV